MPRKADHDERRHQIAVAVCELIATDGLDAVTVARTAAAAGVSVGLVQHYFRTKDAMLLHAFDHVSTQIRGRIDQRIHAGTQHRRPIARVVAEALTELVPLDETRRTEFRVATAFAGRALDAPALAAVDIDTAHALRTDLAQAVHNGKECGEVEANTDTQSAAVRLAAITEGLATHVYREPTAAVGELVTSILDAELAIVFTGECRQYTAPAEP